jgi:mlo protein
MALRNIELSLLLFLSSSPYVANSFIFQLLLAVGTKLEHVITQLAHEVAEKHVAIEGELVVQPSDEHFWFGRPYIVLFLIHFILFQNSFEIGFFFWIWVRNSSSTM